MFLTAALFALPLSLVAANAAGAKDHPMLKRIEGSEIIWSKVSKFDEMKIALEKVQFDYNTKGFKPTKQQVAEGGSRESA